MAVQKIGRYYPIHADAMCAALAEIHKSAEVVRQYLRDIDDILKDCPDVPDATPEMVDTSLFDTRDAMRERLAFQVESATVIAACLAAEFTKCCEDKKAA